ncbi:MAG: heme-binding protein [Planctomycetota bacterium]
MLRLSAIILALGATAFAAPRKTIVETAAEAGAFENLIAAAKFAGLAGTLQEKGPFTVFAPADSAFQRLPQRTLKALLSREGRPQLQRILKFHVVPGRLTASALLSMDRSTTVNGQPLRFQLKNGKLNVNGATVTTANIQCSNGVIHVIDRVLIPEERSLVELAVATKDLSTLVSLVKKANLVDALQGDGPFTILAPTNAAFKRLTAKDFDLAEVLKYHVIPGRATAAEAILLGEAKTLQGRPVQFRYADGQLKVNNANVVATDIFGRNGVVHLIDNVLLPPNAASQRRAAVPTLLETAIDRGVPLFNDGQIEACTAIYEIAAQAVIALGDDAVDSRDRAALQAALRSNSGAREKAWELRRVFDRILTRPVETSRKPAPKRAKSTFKPIMEAAQPVGFPEPGPVGEIVVKEYPRYRMARSKGGFAFGSLFNHIKKNNIDMTSPVEMTMDGNRQQDMAFLYASTELGKVGRQGNVDVVDVPARTVLSIGLRGPISPTKLKQAEQQLRDRLANEKGWLEAGKVRLMGYNSPMVPPERRFYELQIPVKRNGTIH